jgi:restriction system-associated AAA family ATPase
LLNDLSSEDLSNESKTKIELTDKLSETINRLKSCSTTFYESYDEDGNAQLLILDFFVTEETKKAFRFHFEDSPLKLFQALQILYTLNYAIISTMNREKIYSTQNIYLKQDLTSISLDENSIFRIKDLKLQKGNLSEDIFTRSLSDGEYQLLHSIGLCLLYRDTNSLFLLDEPETHFNPDWRAKFITLLKKAFEESDSSQDLLITTHTPYLISDSKRENVLVFEKKMTPAQ